MAAVDSPASGTRQRGMVAASIRVASKLCARVRAAPRPQRREERPVIQHTVSFALRHPADSTEERSFLSDARAALTSIPGVEEFRVARQVSEASPHRFQFSMVFADQAAYSAYNEHPTHVEFVETRWVPEVDSFQELDFVPVD